MTAGPRLPVLYEDDHLLVVHKPAGLPSVPSEGRKGRTCLSELQADHPEVRAVHRLDQETSGALVFARSEDVRRVFVDLFRRHAVKKTYLALVRGAPSPAKGTIERPIQDRGARAAISRHGQEALTRYRVVRRYLEASWVEVEPVTGRYNQIRLHFAAIGHPLIGERKYARGKDSPVRFRRVALHAWRLSFPHPVRGRTVQVEAPLPADLTRLLEGLVR